MMLSICLLLTLWCILLYNATELFTTSCFMRWDVRCLYNAMAANLDVSNSWDVHSVPMSVNYNSLYNAMELLLWMWSLTWTFQPSTLNGLNWWLYYYLCEANWWLELHTRAHGTAPRKDFKCYYNLNVKIKKVPEHIMFVYSLATFAY